MNVKTSKTLCGFFAATNFFFLFWNNSLTNGIIGAIMLASWLILDTAIKEN